MAKSADTQRFEIDGIETDGLDIANLTDGDYLRFTICLTCGQWQSSFPTPLTRIEDADQMNGLGDDG